METDPSGTRVPHAIIFVFLASLGATIVATLWKSGTDEEPRPDAQGGATRVAAGAENAPSLAYWFWTPDVLEDERWRKHAHDLAARGHYDLIFATPRYPMPDLGNIDFIDTERFAPLFREAAEILARTNKRLALDLRFYLGVNRTVEPAQCERLVTAHRVTLDDDGRAIIRDLATPRALFPTASPQVEFGLLGAYDPKTLTRIANVRGRSADGELILQGPPQRDLALLIYRRHNHPDMFSAAYPRAFERTLRAYAEVGLGGVGLDEFAYLPIVEKVWRDTYYWSPASGAAFEEAHDVALDDAIARIAFAQDDAERRRWRLAYFAHRRRGIERMERRFYDLAKRILGEDIFVGVHPTNHNGNDLEFALTALDWWGVKRDFGQTDERTPMAIRMGLALKAGGPVWYNMFYHHDRARILDEIVRCARFGGRVHYHAYHDTFFGAPLEAPGWMEQLASIHARLAPLDRARLGVPHLDTLVIVGWPYMIESAATGDHHVLRRLNDFLDRLWQSGVRAAAVASYEIEAGNLRLDEAGRARYGDRTFTDCILWHPEFSGASTQKFLRDFRGRLRHFGRFTAQTNASSNATQDFSSEAFSPAEIVEERRPEGDALLVRYPGERGIVVDHESLISGKAVERRISFAGTKHTVTVDGVLVLDLSQGTLRTLE